MSGKKWYIVQAYSGMEKHVHKALTERILNAGMQDKFGQILVPSEEVVEVKKGQKLVTEQKLFPGYLLVEMELTDEAWHLVKATPKVSGFVGGRGTKPMPISQVEVDKIMKQMESGQSKPRPKQAYNVGETVRIKEGPFADFEGGVASVDSDRGRVRVNVSIFGRETPVDLEYGQVERPA